MFSQWFSCLNYADQEYSARSRESLNLFLICSLAGCLVSAIIIYNIIFPLSMMFVESRFSDGHEVVLILSIVVMLQCFSNRGVYFINYFIKSKRHTAFDSIKPAIEFYTRPIFYSIAWVAY